MESAASFFPIVRGIFDTPNRGTRRETVESTRHLQRHAACLKEGISRLQQVVLMPAKAAGGV
jgi:hypothetical protein